ncbi:MAG: glycosyltransferase [Planctomycetia bacterium]|nr:glycosyltransferase [Planctomycetia bacterium]
MRTAIVVPCFNEAQRFDTLSFLRFARAAPDVRLLLVNDGSTDDTAAVLTALHKLSPQQVEVYELDKNSGKAEAVRRGVQQAMLTGTDLVGYWDADLATPLEAIPEFRHVLERRSDIDAVLGSRLPLLGRRIDRRPVRRWLGRCFANVASQILSIPIYDTQCGAKLFRAGDHLAAAFATPFLSSWLFDVELLARLSRLRGSARPLRDSLFEYPLDQWREVAGSKLKPRHFVLAAFEAAQIQWRYFGPGALSHKAWRPQPAAIEPLAAASFSSLRRVA